MFYGIAFTIIGILGLCEKVSTVDPVSIISIVIGLMVSGWTTYDINTQLDIYRKQINEIASILDELYNDKGGQKK